MTNYADMSAEARLEALDTMATEYYRKPTWRVEFAAEFDLAAKTLTNWKTQGTTPAWACVAMHYALEARKLDMLKTILRD